MRLPNSSPDLTVWPEVDDRTESRNFETAYTDTFPAVTTEDIRDYRIREFPQ